MVNLNTLEAQKKKAEEEKEANIVKAQIKVYEGQTYEARDAYAEAKAKRGKSRAKLPEKIPEDSTYKEQMLQSQMIQVRMVDPKQRQQVDEYQAEIKSQQKAKETTRILDEQMPALLSQAEQEVESVKQSVYVTAKETATKEQNALIQSFDTQIESETKRRKDEIDAINLKYSSQKNPYPYRAGMKGKSFDNSSYINWNTSTAKAKKAELDAVRTKNITADGFSPASINRGGFIPMPTHPTARKLYTGEAINQHTAKALKNNTPASSIDNRWTRYQVEISRANKAVYEGGSLSAHASAVQAAKNTFDGLALKEQKKHSAQARAESVNQRSQDQKHWNEVISNPNTSGASQTAITALGLSHNVSDLNASGVSSIYNVGDMTKAGFLPTSATVTLNTSSPYKKVGDTVDMIPTRTNTSSDSRTNEKNIIQKQYAKDLRTGKVGLADALLTQRTAGGYTGANTVNLKTFLAERGYNLSRPETIPDSVFKPVKYDEARKQATYAYKTDTEMGDLRNLVPPIQEVSSSTLQTRQKANAERAGIVGTVSKQADMSFAKDKMMSGGAITIQRNASSTNLVSGGKFDPFNADPIKAQENKGYTWTVSVPNTEKFPTMSGGVFEANTPPTEHTFNSKKEAELFAKSSQPKVFSGTDNRLWNTFQYASAVDSGEVIHPSKTKGLYDDALYYANVVNRPLINVGASVVNLTQPEDKQIPIYQTGSERLIGGTIDDVVGGQPLKGSGFTGAWNYVAQDPLRAALELPAEAVMWVGGGKAVSLGTQAVGKVGGKVIQTVVTSSKTPAPVVSGIKTTQRGIEKTQEKMLQYNPFTRWQYKQVEKIGSSVYPDEVPRRIEKIGSTYVITSGTESFPQSVPAVMVKFGKGGKTTYYTDSDLGVAGSKGLVVVGDLPKGIAESTKTGKYLFEVPVKGDRVKLKDPMKLKGNEGRTNTGKEYVTPIESFTKQDVGQQVGFKVSEKTGVARKSDEPPFYRGYTKETIIETSTKPQLTKVKYDMDGKVIKDVPVDNKGSTLKDLFGKTGGTGKKETIDLPTGKSGQTLTTPAKQTGKGDKLKSLAKEEAKSSVKTSPYSSAIVGTATKASAVVGTKALASTRVDTGIKIQQDISTGLVQETALKTQQQLKTPQRLKTGMRMETGLKLDTGSKLMTQQKTATMLTMPKLTSTRSQTPKAVIFVLPKVEEKVSTRKGKRRKKAGFIGNVRLDNVMGMYKRKEITYGTKKVTRLERQDMRLTAGTSNRIAMPASGLLKTKKKKKSKTESVFGRTVTKTRDEFSGFESKSKKKTAKRKKSKSTKVRLM